MADIDLIPHDYRTWLAQQAMLRRYFLAIAVFNAVLLLGGGWLQFSNSNAQTRLAELQAENNVTQLQQAQLGQLQSQQQEYEKQLSLLHGLRAGAAIDKIFAIVDQSLTAGDLWFLDWNFRRAGVIVDGEQRGIETGYFIIVADDGEPAANQDVKIATQMTIHGQAKDHQALSSFVRALFEQSDIEDVNVQKTSPARFADRRVVDFVVTVELNSELQAS